MKEQIEKAVEILRKGGVILYPTDTVWGIGCDATNNSAVERVCRIKNSQDKKSMLVLIDSLDNVSRYVGNVPSVAWDLMELSEKPLTLILPGAQGVAENLIPEEGTLGVRVPKHEFCQKLVRRLGRPLVSTSANISGEPTPMTFAEISQEIKDSVDMIIDTQYARGATNAPSSIIALGKTGEVKVIRE